MADKKRLMAESEQILRQGYSMGDQEYIDGMTAGEVLINGEISRFTGTASFHARLPGPQ